MVARKEHVEALLEVKNRTAVQSALDHLLDMLRLNRRDVMGVRDTIPALYIRLDRDQECYVADIPGDPSRLGRRRRAIPSHQERRCP